MLSEGYTICVTPVGIKEISKSLLNAANHIRNLKDDSSIYDILWPGFLVGNSRKAITVITSHILMRTSQVC